MDFIEQFVRNIVGIYPKPLKEFLRKSIILVKPQRFTGREQVDGSYDIETGEVILWNPNLKDQEGLFLVITHEWGHKLYHEWLSHHDIEEWLFVRSFEKIDFDLAKVYSSMKQPEEEFCTLFSLVSLAIFWEKKGMKLPSKKLMSKLKAEFPLATKTIQKHTKKHPIKSTRDITHREVESLKKWVHKVIDN